MRRTSAAALSVLLALVLAGCVLRGKPKTAKATPPAPKPPAAAVAPPPPPPILSIPQTQVVLPPSQPVKPEALETVPVVQPPETPSPVRLPRPRPAPPAAQPKPENQPPAQPAAQTPPPPETERPPVQPIVPGEDLKKLQESAQARRREAGLLLAGAQGRRLSQQERDLVRRTQSFLNQSEQAESRGDMRQADALAERAQVLARELQSGR